VETYLPWCVEPSVADIAAAFQIEQDARINFWDAMIVAAAARSGATRLFSEDLNHNQRIAGVLVVNPFVG
jgi:predicted nucleic acid-binding protein